MGIFSIEQQQRRFSDHPGGTFPVLPLVKDTFQNLWEHKGTWGYLGLIFLLPAAFLLGLVYSQQEIELIFSGDGLIVSFLFCGFVVSVPLSLLIFHVRGYRFSFLGDPALEWSWHSALIYVKFSFAWILFYCIPHLLLDKLGISTHASTAYNIAAVSFYFFLPFVAIAHLRPLKSAFALLKGRVLRLFLALLITNGLFFVGITIFLGIPVWQYFPAATAIPGGEAAASAPSLIQHLWLLELVLVVVYLWSALTCSFAGQAFFLCDALHKQAARGGLSST